MSTISTAQEGALTLRGAGEGGATAWELSSWLLLALFPWASFFFFFLMYVGKSQCAKGKLKKKKAELGPC